MRSILITQVIITAVLAAYFSTNALHAVVAAGFGGFVAIGNTLLHGLRIHRMQKHLAKNPKEDVLGLMLGAVERIAFTFIMLIVGFSVLKLHVTTVLITFAACYVAYFYIAARIGMGKTVN